MTFRVGQEVVCVDDTCIHQYVTDHFFVVGDLDGLKKGVIYTVRGVLGEVPFRIGPQIYLEEIVRPFCPINRHEVPFAAARFRPVKKTSIDFFTSMLNPAPQHNREKADA